jgi:hypothetical protein
MSDLALLDSKGQGNHPAEFRQRPYTGQMSEVSPWIGQTILLKNASEVPIDENAEK